MSRVCHLAAFLGTFAAGFRTDFAVRHVIGVFFALGRAGITRVSARLHILRHKLRPTGFEPTAEGADISAVAAELDTGRHVVAFAVGVAHVKAGRYAPFAGLGAIETGVGVAVVVLHHVHTRCALGRPALVCPFNRPAFVVLLYNFGPVVQPATRFQIESSVRRALAAALRN